ncbi:TauD/TfdA family dioxygenase [Bradyrhizobium sp. SSUT18]|uniref:TauD/TfdA dioxygenase family protein n=1 Tax=Bradyrhizobium sp. SSUT18 TaxID=3040602 RepID=UPI002448E0EC|nr:TauD/TfdA family dioxygenase [Bradyrhizobium sp. SSUT18]MDH2399889.1 TauD/TfdA family dioxygenase [Bradyrhizobium sp. SSUT18]
MAVVLEQSVAETAKSHQNLSVRPYKPLIGAVIENVDLTKPLSDRNREDLNRALVEHGVIFIRNQALNDAQHVELASIFGKPIRKNIYLPSVSAFPEIEVIAHDEHTKSGGTDNWHVDVSWQREPPKATVLHIKQVPAGGGGDTIWASSSAAYDLLDPDLARYFEKLTAVNTFVASPKKAALSDLLSGYAAGHRETAEEGLARVHEAKFEVSADRGARRQDASRDRPQAGLRQRGAHQSSARRVQDRKPEPAELSLRPDQDARNSGPLRVAGG